VEQHGLIGIDEILIEGEADGRHFSNEGRQAIDSVCDFVDACVHAQSPVVVVVAIRQK
jgi:hypothetical protein